MAQVSPYESRPSHRNRCSNLGMSGQPAAVRCSKKSDLRLQRLDRKSTRLNSSHSSISYAVFCLKKKKLINRFIYLYLVESILVIKEWIFVIILLMHLLSLIVIRMLVLMIPLFVCMTTDLVITKS